MKAAVCHEFGKPLVIEEVFIDEPRKNEVKVKVLTCAICHSDVHYIDGAWGGTLPAIYGHEAAGIIESVGKGVSDYSKGDRVIVSLLKCCGECFHCDRGEWNLCEGDFSTSEPGRLRSDTHGSILRGLGTGCFAEYAIVHQSQVSSIPASMNISSASLLACGVITGFGAVTHTAQVEAGNHVAVVGVGGVGLNAIQAAAIAGCASVIAVDISDDRLKIAQQLGATHGINSARSDARQSIREIVSGRGADYVFVATGHPGAINEAVSFTRKGGSVILAGMPAVGVETSFETVDFIDANQTIKGCKMGESTLAEDIPKLVDLYQSGTLKLDELVTNQYPLSDINKAVDATREGIGLRNVVVF